MKVKIWGTRGSIPSPGPHTVKYGGNTICLEFRFEPDNRLIILDAGSGIRHLGMELMQTEIPKGPLKLDLFFSHTHWDHILGFPFFIPIYVPTTELNIYGPVTFEDDPLEKVVSGQMQYRYFPITTAELSAKLKYFHLKETEKDLGDGIHLKTKYLNHPLTCLGYRFTQGNKTIVTLFDHEPYHNLFAAQAEEVDEDVLAEGEQISQEQNQKIIDFMRGADLVLHDAQYTEEEYVNGRQGWGHSSFESAINSAAKAGVKHLVLLHHDPERSDQEIDELQDKYRRLIAKKSSMKVSFAREGMEL
jgi:phosphoribosyl 1,2-cyclic phosphodiesterase